MDNTILRKPLLTRAEVANMLGISVQTVQRMIDRGELETKRISKRLIRIPAESIERYLSEKGGAK